MKDKKGYVLNQGPVWRGQVNSSSIFLCFRWILEIVYIITIVIILRVVI